MCFLHGFGLPNAVERSFLNLSCKLNTMNPSLQTKGSRVSAASCVYSVAFSHSHREIPPQFMYRLYPAFFSFFDTIFALAPTVQ